MDLRTRLQALADALPPSGAVTLTRADLVEMLAAEGGSGEARTTTAADMTIGQVAEQLGRSPSTVRNWLGEQRLPGAYRLRGREWRIPPATLQSFLQAEASGDRGATSAGRGTGANLSDWRRVKRVS